MKNSRIDKLLHQTLRRPYKLVRSIDQGDSEPIVILLHGIGRSGKVWQPLAEELVSSKNRLVALDLLGFGDSPKPAWLDYSIEQHALAVIHAIKKIKSKRPIILVGHSLGCLVATHVAWSEPKLVSKLILFEMPLYASEINDSRRYKVNRDARLAFYKSIIKNPERSMKYARKLGKLGVRLDGPATMSAESVYPYASTLKNSIIEQKTYGELLEIDLPIEIIYGTRDMFVIRANMRKMFKSNENISFTGLKETHGVSPRAAKYLASQIKKSTDNS